MTVSADRKIIQNNGRWFRRRDRSKTPADEGGIFDSISEFGDPAFSEDGDPLRFGKERASEFRTSIFGSTRKRSMGEKGTEETVTVETRLRTGTINIEEEIE